MKELLKEFALACVAAEDNPRLLIEDYEKYVELCIERMDKIMETERLLLGLPISDDSPVELVRYLAAAQDQGCGKCWYAGSDDPNKWADHPECNAKIQAYFVARQGLINYGVKL